MNLFALTGQMPGPEAYMSILWLVALFAIFYFLLIRPQKKQQKKEEAMRNSIEAGDRVCTIGGVVGKVLLVDDDEVVIESNNSRLRFRKWAIREKIEKDNEEEK